MGPIGVWGPHGIKGWCSGLMGQPHHLATMGPCGLGLKPISGPTNPNPRAAGLGAKAPQPPALEGDGGAPLGLLYKEDQGGQPHPLDLLHLAATPCPSRTSPPPLGATPSRRAAAISSTKAAAPPLAVGLLHHLLVLLLVPWLRRSPARGNLHHQRHHNRRGAEIHLAISTLLEIGRAHV